MKVTWKYLAEVLSFPFYLILVIMMNLLFQVNTGDTSFAVSILISSVVVDKTLFGDGAKPEGFSSKSG